MVGHGALEPRFPALEDLERELCLNVGIQRVPLPRVDRYGAEDGQRPFVTVGFAARGSRVTLFFDGDAEARAWLHAALALFPELEDD